MKGHSISIYINIDRCKGEKCASQNEIDEFINRIQVRTRASQKMVDFDTEDKSNNLRTSIYEVDFI